MKIRKAFQGTMPENKILDTYSTSQTDTYSCNYVNGLQTYSTTEKAIGEWTDGKTIYRKCLSGTTPDGTSSAIITGVSKIIDHHIMIKRNGVDQYHPLSPTMDSYDSNHASPLFLTGTDVKLYISNSNYKNQSYYGWIEYTKSS